MEHVLTTPRCAVWADMGMGKTSAVLTAIDHLRLAGETDPVLVVAPLRVAATVWTAEAQKWRHLCGLEVVPVVGRRNERIQALAQDAPVYTCSYDSLIWMVEYFGAKWPFRTVVADESTRLKSFRLNQGGRRARALARVAHTRVKRFIELTGTPSPNGLKDLWGQMWYLDEGLRLERTYTAFMRRWFTTGYDGYSIIPHSFAQEQIQDRVRDLCHTVAAKDWFDLREPVVSDIYVELPRTARARYTEMEREMYTEIGTHGVDAVNAAVRTQKCLQIASGNVWVDREQHEWREVHDAKLQALGSVLNESAGMPVLVVYQWVPSMQRILKAFPQARTLDMNPQTVNDWNAGRIPLLVVHPKSAGHGLNLQDGGNIVVFFDHWWNLEEYQQVIERIGPTRQRQSGHDRPVYVHHIIARDTVDEMVMERRASKRSVQDILLDALKRF